MPYFISIRIFKRFFKVTLNFIIKSFQIKHFYLKKMAEYRWNLRGTLAKNGPAQLKFGPDRPGPARPDLSSLGFTTLILSSNTGKRVVIIFGKIDILYIDKIHIIYDTYDPNIVLFIPPVFKIFSIICYKAL